MARSSTGPRLRGRNVVRRVAGSFVVRLSALAIVVLLPLVVASVVQAREAHDRAREEVEERALSVAQTAAAAHGGHVRSQHALLRRFASSPDLVRVAATPDDARARDLCRSTLDTAQDATGSAGLLVATSGGGVHCTTTVSTASRGRLVALAGTALDLGRAATIGPYFAEGALRISIATPIVDDGSRGRTTAVAASVDVTWLDDLGPAADGDGDLVVLIGAEGELLGASGLALPASVLGRPPAGGPDLAEFPDLTPGSPVVGEVSLPEPRLFAAVALSPELGDGYVTVSRPADAVFEPVAVDWVEKRQLLAGAIALAVLIGAGAAWWGLVRPVRRLVASTERIGAGDDDARADLGRGGGELVRVGVAVDEMAARLRERAAHLALQTRLLEAANDAVFAVDAAECVTSWNHAAERLLGWNADEVLGRRLSELHDDPAGRAEVAGLVRRVQETGTFREETILPRRDGLRVPVLVSISVVADPNGATIGAIVVLVDVSAQKEAERETELRASRQRALGRLGERALHADVDEVVAAAVEVIESELPGVRAQIRLDPETLRSGPHHHPAAPLAPAATSRTQAIDGSVGHHGEIVVQWDEAGAWSLDAPFVQSIAQLVAVALDRALADAELRRLALHDDLTGLPNRRLLVDRVERCATRARRGGDPFAVLYLDLDRFKVVNDGLGHPAGDRLLIEVAQRLRRAGREQDTVARLGGDEFAILCEDLDDPAIEAARVAERILAGLREPIEVNDEQVVATASVGVAIGGTGSTGAEGVLKEADLALYRAKERGRDRYAIFNDEMQAGVTDRLGRINELRRSIVEKRFEVWYQPEVSLSDGTVWAEALVRWDHPGRGLLVPSEFVPLAEDTGLIVELGAWVLDEACAQLARWCDEDPDGAPGCVSVNLSPRQLLHPHLVAQVRETLARTGVDPSMLFLELTEGAIADDPEHAREVLEELKSLGVGLAIDDFGTGYSSLSHLRRFPVDALKIDRAFITRVPDGGDDDAIVEAIVGLARSLGLLTIAEGVETEDQVQLLTRLGCDFAQGYVFARALPAAELPEFVRGRRQQVAQSARRIADGAGTVLSLGGRGSSGRGAPRAGARRPR